MRTRIALVFVAAALVAGCSSATHTWTRTAAPPTPAAVLAMASAAPLASPTPAVTPKATPVATPKPTKKPKPTPKPTPRPSWATWHDDMCAATAAGAQAVDHLQRAWSGSLNNWLAPGVHDAVKGEIEAAQRAMFGHGGPAEFLAWEPGGAAERAFLDVRIALGDAIDTWKWWLALPTSELSFQGLDANSGAKVAMGTLDAEMKAITAEYHMGACQ